MIMHGKAASFAAAILLLASCVSAQPAVQPPAQQPPPQRQVVLTIMSQQVNNFAPGIDAAVAVTQEQANKLAGVYREVYESNAVVLATMVMQDNNATMAQRRVATALLQQAQATFQASARTVFTEPQQQLIDQVQAAFTKVSEAAQTDLNARVKSDFAAELDKLLTPEQKQAMLKARQAIEEAQRKAQVQQPAPATTPAH